MVKALASRWTRGGSRIRLAIGLGVLWPMGLLAQPLRPTAPPREAPSNAKVAAEKPSAAATAKVADGAEKGGAAESNATIQEAPDIQRDERAEAILKKTETFKPIRSEPGPIPDQALVEKMAQTGIPDATLLDTYVRYQASQMTSKSLVLTGLAAAINKPVADDPKQAAAIRKQNEAALQQIEKCFVALVNPVTIATRSGRNEFLQAYTRSLLKVMPELLQNHLYARIEGMIVLSKTGQPAAIKTFVQQLEDPEQVVMVKLLAAHGLTNVVRSNRQQGIEPRLASDAARALNDFLTREPKAIWPAQFRAFEALGWLRVASTNPLSGRFEMADTAMKFLADPKVRIEVRAWAAWALGMMRVDANAKINYAKATHDLGELAIDLGNQILAVRSSKTDDQAHDLIALLAVPVYNALNGEPDLQSSGLTKSPSLGKAAPFVKGLEPLIKRAAVDAVTLGRTPPNLHRQAQRELEAHLRAIRDYLNQNPPRVADGPGPGPMLEATAAPAGGPPRGR